MYPVVIAISPGTPAAKTIISPGDTLRKINGITVSDVLDYKYLSYDVRLILELAGPDGRIKLVRLRKPEGAELGLEFGTLLMDKQRSCVNKCIFCFIDQLPEDMRETLYYKDDDVRLSFLQGNYVTLTNLSPGEISRIIKLRVSPINVSVHTMNPELRSFMLGVKNGEAGISALKAFAEAGIRLNCQIVCCPGINDGAELSRTMEALMDLGGSINSVSVVPVGLTKHRRGLAPLQPYNRRRALSMVRQVEKYAERCLERHGSRIFYCADELYMKAGLALPPHRYYEGYPQLENGVGMMRLFITEFLHELRHLDNKIRNPEFGIRNNKFRVEGASIKEKLQFTIVTGKAAGKYLTKLLKIAMEKYDNMNGQVCIIRNEFFGDGITVSGLITGRDIIAGLKDRDLGSKLLIQQNMLRSGEDVFLDNLSVRDVSETLGVPIQVVKQNGTDFYRAMIGTPPKRGIG